MNIGIICEFNPFHKGHERALQVARSYAEGGFVVAIMSGNFVQRGEPAIFDKGKRAEWAILGGADIVIELPPFFALATSETFAIGGVSILDKLGIVDGLLFGSECGDIDALTEFARTDFDDSPIFKDALKEGLSRGESFVLAKSNAVKKLLGSSLIDTPNNILGIEYIKSLDSINSKIIPLTYKRGEISISSSVIRENLRLQKSVTGLTPSFVEKAIRSAKSYDENLLFALIRERLYSGDRKSLSEVDGISEGLENNFFNALSQASSLEQFYFEIKSKRHTLSKIKRIALSYLLKMDKSIAMNAKINLSHALILAIREDKRELLSKISEPFTLITKSRDYDLLSGDQQPFIFAEQFADKIYSILINEPKANLLSHTMKVISI